MKKALSLMLTMCLVLSLFATFVISASAEEATNLAAVASYACALVAAALCGAGRTVAPNARCCSGLCEFPAGEQKIVARCGFVA